jgi:RNA polymerase-binding protein DksA
MKKNKNDFYRLVLLNKKKFTSQVIERLRDISQISEDKSGLYDKFSSHQAEDGSATAGIEESSMLISRELQYLNHIERALQAIDSGTYGICRLCGKDIPHARLKAVPTADTCVECKSTNTKNIILN